MMTHLLGALRGETETSPRPRRAANKAHLMKVQRLPSLHVLLIVKRLPLALAATFEKGIEAVRTTSTLVFLIPVCDITARI